MTAPTPAELLQQLEALGGKPLWEEGRLVFWLPKKGLAPPALAEALKSRREEIARHIILAMLPAYGLGLCDQCGRILVTHHLAVSADGRLVCHDTADCLEARAAAREASNH